MAHSLDFIGMISQPARSEIHPRQAAVADPGFIQRFARAHEEGGFDPLEDAIAVGRDLLPASRAAVATHTALPVAAE